MTMVNYCLFACLLQIFILRSSLCSHIAQTPVLILDVDNTLYEEKACLIESQIQEGCKSFAKESFGINFSYSDDLHKSYGSTIRGIYEEYKTKISKVPRMTNESHNQSDLMVTSLPMEKNVYADYYNQVYPWLNMSKLRRYSNIFDKVVCNSFQHSEIELLTGYSKNVGSKQHRKCLEALYFLHKQHNCRIVLASNSPIFHLQRVLTRLGIADLNIDSFFTPERCGGCTKTEAEFWNCVLECYPTKNFACTLVDDNYLNSMFVEDKMFNMTSIHIKEDVSLVDAITAFILNPWNPKKMLTGFQIDEAKYLQCKNLVDDISFNESVKNRLIERLQGKSGKYRFLDLGCGLFNMLDKVISWIESNQLLNTERLDYIAIEANTKLHSSIIEKMKRSGFSISDETAALIPVGAFEGLRLRQFQKSLKSGALVNVYLVLGLDFMAADATTIVESINKQIDCKGEDTLARSTFDLIIGAGLADLFQPEQLMSQLLEFNNDSGALLYLPITFDGATSLKPESRRKEVNEDKAIRKWRPFLSRNLFGKKSKEEEEDKKEEREEVNDSHEIKYLIESSKSIMEHYHESLRERGHFTNADDLLKALRRSGARLIGQPGDSSWVITPSKSAYFWRCMWWFISRSTAISLVVDRTTIDIPRFYDSLSNLESYLQLEVKNVDILAQLPQIEQAIGYSTGPQRVNTLQRMKGLSQFRRIPSFSDPNLILNDKNEATIERSLTSLPHHVVEFVAPLKVTVTELPWLRESALARDHVLISTKQTLVSTGTELKIFKGTMDCNEPLDLTIAGMTEGWKYPVQYGYSLVGKVVAAGEDCKSLLNASVFSFASHATATIQSAKSVMIIPEGVHMDDAVFLPSMETALSLVMSASILVGERVCIIGQGLIGTLVAAVVQTAIPAAHVTVADISDIRLATSRNFLRNSSIEFWNPKSADNTKATDFDVCIEVSGSMSGLQLAVDSTRKGGRVVIGSWYDASSGSSQNNKLTLDTRFHRSGISLISSQVSHLPAFLTDRWSKERRFNETWNMIKAISPSKLIASHSVVEMINSTQVQRAFTLLSHGNWTTALLTNPLFEL